MARLDAAGVTEVSGQTVIAKISGETVIAEANIVSTAILLPVDIQASAINVPVTGTVVAKVSGETVNVNIASSAIMVPVDIQGVTVDLPVTGGPVIAKISGETVVAEISGQTVVAEISGQTIIAKVSGETVLLAPPSTLLYGRVIVGSTPTQLGTGGISAVAIKSESGNSEIWIGDASVNSGVGYVLYGKEEIIIEIDNLNKIYLYAAVSGQAVTYLAVA